MDAIGRSIFSILHPSYYRGNNRSRVGQNSGPIFHIFFTFSPFVDESIQD